MAERLSRERILEVAARLAREDGLDALSMRRIAEQLDVWPMSLYRHFQDKDALLDALTDDVRPVAPLPSRRRAWDGQLRELAEQVRVAVLSQPAGLGDRLARVLETPAMLDVAAAAEEALERGGVTADPGAAWRAIATYAFGAAVRGLDDAAFDGGLELLLDGLRLHVTP